MDSKLDWAERTALERLRSLRQAADGVAREASKTLTILLVAIGAAFAYAIATPQFALAATVLTAYLCVLSVVLVFTCLMAAEPPSAGPIPGSAAMATASLDELRELELAALTHRIAATASLHARRSLWLNCVRIGAIVAPFVFVAAVLYAGRAPLSFDRAVLARSDISVPLPERTPMSLDRQAAAAAHRPAVVRRSRALSRSAA